MNCVFDCTDFSKNRSCLTTFLRDTGTEFDVIRSKNMDILLEIHLNPWYCVTATELVFTKLTLPGHFLYQNLVKNTMKV